MAEANTDFSFFEIAPDLSPLNIVDVGAALGTTPPFYQALLDQGRATVTGFEPDPEAFARLQERAAAGERYFPTILGDGQPATLHLTTYGYTSSLYEPNDKLIGRFSHFSQFMERASSRAVQTARLDDVLSDPEIDLLKLDVQGAELDVMRGAPRLLATALVVETEVEFVPLYVDQPLFADVDRHLRGGGFQFHTFGQLAKSFYAPATHPTRPNRGLHQITYTDAIYVRDLDLAEALPRERLLKLIAILHDLYRSWDLCLHLLQKLAKRGEPALFSAYLKRLQGHPQ